MMSICQLIEAARQFKTENPDLHNQQLLNRLKLAEIDQIELEKQMKPSNELLNRTYSI